MTYTVIFSASQLPSHVAPSEALSNVTYLEYGDGASFTSCVYRGIVLLI